MLIGAALAGAIVAGIVAAIVFRMQRARLVARMAADADALRDALALAQTRADEADAARREQADAWARKEAGFAESLARQAADADAQRDACQAALAQKGALTQQAEKIVHEAARLRGLAGTFERWHEQMTSLTTQNQDMRAKNLELSAIVASEVRGLAARSQELSNSYRDSLNRNDLVTAATFQDIQAGGKMITAALATVETLAGQLHARLEGAAA